MSMYSSEIPTQSPGMLAHPLTLATGSSFSFLLPTALFCRQSCSLHFSVLPWTFLFSSSTGLTGNQARKPFVWVSRQNRQRNLLTGTYPHPYNECPTSCHIYIYIYIYINRTQVAFTNNMLNSKTACYMPKIAELVRKLMT